MKFSGMRDPRTDVPLIEIETTDGRLVDLYNENFLRCVVRRRDELAFDFDSWPDRSVRTSLQFQGVRDLRISQPDDWHPGEAEQIDHLLVRSKGPWPRIVFMAGGLEYEFNSTELRCVVEHAPLDAD